MKKPQIFLFAVVTLGILLFIFNALFHKPNIEGLTMEKIKDNQNVTNAMNAYFPARDAVNGKQGWELNNALDYRNNRFSQWFYAVEKVIGITVGALKWENEVKLTKSISNVLDSEIRFHDIPNNSYRMQRDSSYVQLNNDINTVLKNESCK